MKTIPYANVVVSFMYDVVCTCPNIAYVVSIMSTIESKLQFAGVVNEKKHVWAQVRTGDL